MGIIYSNSDIRGHVGESTTTEYVWNAGKAFAEWLPEEGVVAVVKTQAASDGIAHAFVEGLLLQGRTVVDPGVGEQQQLVNTISDAKAAGGALISHDAAQNLAVITLLDASGAVVTSERGLDEITRLIESGNFLPAAIKGTLKTT